ncbi:ABC transporter permease [Pseudarthrobacter raffinosi]|uniref:ABC transporter permease n=1 Tax=Pseudarthrobacter raffinosi TaxID=2953651 RepID=UPI00208E88BD|nr:MULTISPECIES: ABC transporter permease [unclassified Pseudarthrobacter]MCO4237247.1 ABC transporter permease [Pseudarthrobacter sp. MDT3-28]MCO4252783.1 ABC transporter permease [Pseudarthrobacter sp. MDT3-9]MCO4264963.1 ABC transporter permease [Pseudarthrobacter sp. MDT3-26]
MSNATLQRARPEGRAPAPEQEKPRRRRTTWWLLLAPILAFDVVLFLSPLGKLVGSSFTGNAYQRVLEDPLVVRSLINTLSISLASTVVTVVLGYVIALVLWRSGTVTRVILFAVVLLPFWTGILVKNFAWAVLLQDNGIVNSFLQTVGLTDAPIELLHNRLAVIIGMVHCLLPYAVFPIFSSLTSIDDRLALAARSLGAKEASIFRRIILPLSTPGISAAGLLVFIISTGFFITPVVMGGPGDMMIANQIDYYARQLTDFSGAAALAVILTVLVSILVAIYQRVLKAGGQHADN